MPDSQPSLFRLFILSIIISVCILEVIYRFAFLNSWDLVQADAFLNHRGTPGYRKEDGGILVIQHNSRGWLELADIPPIPSEKKKRIVFMGDSFTYGTANFFESMPRVVERILNQADPEKFEVINAGFPSYAPVIYRVQLEREVLPLQPAMVFVSIDMADIVDDYLYRGAVVIDQNGKPQAVPAHSTLSLKARRVAEGVVERSGWDTAVRTAGQYSALIFRFSRALDASRYSQVPDPRFPRVRDWCQESAPNEFQTHVNETLQDVSSLVTTIRSAGVVPVITFIPRLEHLTGECSIASASSVKRATESAGGYYFDSFQAFKTERSEEWYEIGDIHFNAQGNKRWGEAIATQILDLQERTSS